MTGGLPVGTVCIGQNYIHHAERNGMECVVIGGLDVSDAVIARTGEVVRACATYEVEWSDGFIDNVQPRHLRRKQPPTGELSILRMFDLTAPVPREVEVA